MRPAIEVTQADREAAAAYYYSAGGSPNIARDIREGRKDNWFRVQAFPRHRADERAKVLAEIVAELRDLDGIRDESNLIGWAANHIEAKFGGKRGDR